MPSRHPTPFHFGPDETLLYHQPQGLVRGASVLYVRTRKRMRQRLGLNDLSQLDLFPDLEPRADDAPLRQALESGPAGQQARHYPTPVNRPAQGQFERLVAALSA
ncbi:MAG: hypothetical protein AB7S38_03435 [Vulcanimicrobiota bacterium]